MRPSHGELRDALTDLGDRELLAWTETCEGYWLTPADLPAVSLGLWHLAPRMASRPLAVLVVQLPDGRLVVPGADPAGLVSVLQAVPDALRGPEGPRTLVALASPAVGDWMLREVVDPLVRRESGWHTDLRVRDGAGRRLQVVLNPLLEVVELESLLL